MPFFRLMPQWASALSPNCSIKSEYELIIRNSVLAEMRGAGDGSNLRVVVAVIVKSCYKVATGGFEPPTTCSPEYAS